MTDSIATLKKKLSIQRKNVERKPTDPQKEAGNYKMGHISVNGFQITIENPKGSYREGDGWKIQMKNDYGYFVATKGKDNDAVDVFLGPNLKSNKIFVVDQNNSHGAFDESKVMLGFDTTREAKSAYMSNYEKGWKGFRNITEVDKDTFKEWLYNGKRHMKPFGEYVQFKKSKKHRVVKITESQYDYVLNCPL